MPCAWAAQSRCSGHIRHEGRLGVHRLAPRSISACAKSPARFAGVSVPARRRISSLAAGSGFLTANSRAITRSMLPSTGVARCAEGDGGDRRGRVGADARQLAQLLLRRGELAGEALGDDAGAGVQIAGAAVVAEARPRGEHVVERGRGECRNRRPARQEALVEGDDGCHGGLLQHDLGQPDRVGVGHAPRRRPPGQIAPLAVVPVEHGAGRVLARQAELQLLSCHTSHGPLMGLEDGLVPARRESFSPW